MRKLLVAATGLLFVGGAGLLIASIWTANLDTSTELGITGVAVVMAGLLVGAAWIVEEL